MTLLLQAYASRGYISVAIDSRYHGERASNEEATYIDVTYLTMGTSYIIFVSVKFDSCTHLFRLV